jgi:hypothetical protein
MNFDFLPNYCTLLGNCDTCECIENFIILLRQNPGMKDELHLSLRAAKENAGTQLNALLYNALDWPINEREYVNYLINFAMWIPQPDVRYI